MLHLNVDNPGWDDARGYLLAPSGPILYFPMAKKYFPDNPIEMRVLIRSSPRIIAQGALTVAASQHDAEWQFELAMRQGMKEGNARYMIFDKRTGKPRNTRYKLLVAKICATGGTA
jgi:hypothetical protein